MEREEVVDTTQWTITKPHSELQNLQKRHNFMKANSAKDTTSERPTPTNVRGNSEKAEGHIIVNTCTVSIEKGGLFAK